MSHVTLEYLRPGKSTVVYRERLIIDRSDVKVLLTDPDASRDIRVDGALILQAGAPILWFVFPGAWHDIGRFHLADGSFTGWYTNLCTPILMKGSRWSATDLFLDHWLPPSGDGRWLDEEEFSAAVASGVLTTELTDAARAERDRVKSLIASSAWPPAIVRQMNLATTGVSPAPPGEPKG
jgi:predicted RNA-binding protein associated with RNAse of E/G family